VVDLLRSSSYSLVYFSEERNGCQLHRRQEKAGGVSTGSMSDFLKHLKGFDFASIGFMVQVRQKTAHRNDTPAERGLKEVQTENTELYLSKERECTRIFPM
jgi:hypothetical protein